MRQLVNLFKGQAPDGTYEDAARREAMAQALRERAMRQRGPQAGGPVQAQYGIGEGLTQLAEALLARRAGRSAIDAKKQADTQQTQRNDETLREMLPATEMQSQRMSFDAQGNKVASSNGQIENMQSDALSMALRGQDPQAIGKFLAERKLQTLLPEQNDPITLPYGAKLVTPQGEELTSNNRIPYAGNVGEKRGWINDYMQTYGVGLKEATDAYARAFRGTYSNAEVAGVQGARDNLTGSFRPDTTIGTVANNAAEVTAAEEGGKVEGATETTRFYTAPLAKVAVEGAIGQADAFINKVGALANDPNLDRATGLWNYVPSIYGGGAADVDAAIDSLLADVGFQNLQNMRDNSKTGGALGQVTVRELEMLQNQVASLRQSQSTEAYIRNLKTLIKMAQGRKDRLLKAYEAEFGSQAARNPRGTRPQPAQPSQPAQNETVVDW